MQAAFVNIGQDVNAFLPFSEISDSELIVEKNNKTQNSKEVDVLLQPDKKLLFRSLKSRLTKWGTSYY